MTYTIDSTPACSAASANGTTLRIAPLKPAPKPVPATAVPTKNPAADEPLIDINVIATPTINAPLPTNITDRAAVLRNRTTDPAPAMANANRAKPPRTNELCPIKLRTTVGASDP